jgi:hypothetical protein
LANTSTHTATSTSTNIPTRTLTAVPPTATRLPIVAGLPGSGGAPIRSQEFPWGLATMVGFGLFALALGVQAYQRSRMSK